MTTRMSTRSSARQPEYRKVEPKEDSGRPRQTKRQSNKPRLELVLSDDSDEDTRTLYKPACKSTRKQRSQRSSSCSSSRDEGTTNFSTPRKQKQQNTVSYASPPKQRKLSENVPRTPQHKPKSEQVETPSKYIDRLTLTSPAKPTETSSSNKKQLFTDKKLGRTSVYQDARKALHSTSPIEMPGREKELAELRDFIKSHIENNTSGSMYISGPPGTGKTASLNMIFAEEEISSKLQKVYVNCTAIKSPTAIYSRIAKELQVKVTGRTEKDYLAAVEKYLKKQNKMVLLVLDEIDQLESKNQSILYTIFEWPAKAFSHLILVGIANALDLTDRILPRLQARCELKPTLMHFAPYTKQQIVEIFTSRLKSAGVLEVFTPVALQMLAGKVAAVSGDVRRALDIGRRVIELVDQEVLKPIENLAGDKLKTVELKQVVDVLNSVYGTAQTLTEDKDDTFPLQQKIVICTLVLMLKKAKNKDITVGRLHEVYKRICGKRNILSVDQAEFVGLCSLIETRGIVRVSGKKEPRLQKVNLEWDEEEVAGVLRDQQLLSSIIQDETVLGKL
ncbi:hypothetical protein NQ315_016401 [Exocentrus adspersus]|uniref:Cell division control protein n=1 Tax=Exocentrus adspersus TaxID=1586481 RepID=A0AAV8VPC5_9CUCU|nr:hypothetical protein NQ315_016401 [Exocentrus adspersus]